MAPLFRLLIYVPVSLYRKEDGSLLMEAQAINGLKLWAKNFPVVTCMAPLAEGTAPAGWVSVAELGDIAGCIDIRPLPAAWTPLKFLREFRGVRRTIAAEIRRADALCFAIGGLFGDWGAVASFVAYFQRRRYAVWTDRVESEVVWRLRKQGSLKRQLWYHVLPFAMSFLERAVIRRAALGLFHGQETFDAYAPFCAGKSYVVHDIHIRRADHITPEGIKEKKSTLRSGPLQICYVGRLDAMKGADDWVETLSQVAAAGVDFRATWIGDGPARASVEARVAQLGLCECIKFPGFLTDRSAVLDVLRRSHMMVFCHKTPESPRCLIEALISATPIIGYHGAFAADLITGHGGGLLVPRDNVTDLAARIVALSNQSAFLASLIDHAAADGAPFDDESVFRHRSDLIYRHILAD